MNCFIVRSPLSEADQLLSRTEPHFAFFNLSIAIIIRSKTNKKEKGVLVCAVPLDLIRKTLITNDTTAITHKTMAVK